MGPRVSWNAYWLTSVISMQCTGLYIRHVWACPFWPWSTCHLYFVMQPKRIQDWENLRETKVAWHWSCYNCEAFSPAILLAHSCPGDVIFRQFLNGIAQAQLYAEFGHQDVFVIGIFDGHHTTSHRIPGVLEMWSFAATGPSSLPLLSPFLLFVWSL